ncbi:transglycosylase SLT domain-containing protein [Roseateles albus]|uniref:Transporter substrate-binding domain-containing protein n=1 Tax=Roseateles albus TaxID=2987525 RepID=A0ABT5KBQ5_9BURK|nr:transporter substrate-binding domain-containing protein [Roseateles albus]MDC8771235.1 transporter substrate-binding domain-containing protein [Roseateles albus]
MRQFFQFITLSLLLLGAAQARSLQEIKQSRELRVCLAPIHPSYSSVEPSDCKDGCSFSGPVHEQSLAFAQSLGQGVQAKFMRVGWDEQFFDQSGKTVKEGSYTPRLLASGRCDFFPNNLTKIDWRLKKLDFVILRPNRNMVIVHAAQKSSIKKQADLAGKSSAVEMNSSWHGWLLASNQADFAHKPIKLALLPTQQSFHAVDAGTVDFIVTDADMAFWAVRNQLKHAQVAFPVGPLEEIGWAFAKQDKDLQAAVQSFFDAQRNDPNSAINQSWQKHFGTRLTDFTTLMLSIK